MTPVMKATLKDQDVEVLNVSEIDGPNHGFVNGVKKALIKVDQEKVKLFLKFSAHPIYNILIHSLIYLTSESNDSCWMPLGLEKAAQSE